MTARIYRPSRTAMQSGTAKTREWVLEHDAQRPRAADPLMGWTSSADTQTQLRLGFATQAEAEAYARANGIAYRVFPAEARPRVKKAYADNFRFGRHESWTH